MPLDLPPDLKAKATERAAAYGYESLDAYVADLVRYDIAQDEGGEPMSPELEVALMEGMDESGDKEWDPEEFRVMMAANIAQSSTTA